MGHNVEYRAAVRPAVSKPVQKETTHQLVTPVGGCIVITGVCLSDIVRDNWSSFHGIWIKLGRLVGVGVRTDLVVGLFSNQPKVEVTRSKFHPNGNA